MRVNRAKTGDLTELATRVKLGLLGEKKPETLQFFANTEKGPTLDRHPQGSSSRKGQCELRLLTPATTLPNTRL